MSARRRTIEHTCREHILVRHGVNGGGTQFVCSVCRKEVRMRPLQQTERKQ